MAIVLTLAASGLSTAARPPGQIPNTPEQRRAVHARLHGEKHRGAKPLVPGVSMTVMDARGVVMSGQPVTASQFVQDLACKADLVVAAEIATAEPALTPAGNFVFTDYTATVATVLKGDLTRELRPGERIVVTRPGGTVLLEGKPTSSISKSALPLEAGARYLLFLERVPDADSYLAEGAYSAFLFDHDELRPASEEQVPEGRPLQRNQVDQAFARIASGPC